MKKAKRKNAGWQALIIILPLLAFLASLPVFYYSISPGTAEEVESLITVEGYPPPSEGQFYLTAVRVDDLSVLTLAQAKLLEHEEVESLRDLVGPQRSYSDYNARSDVGMELSQETAIAVALKQEGYEVGEKPAGVIILGIAADSSMSDQAEVGDIIVAVDGQEVTDLASLKALLASGDPLRTVELTVMRDGETTSYPTQLGTTEGDDPQPVLGIFPRDYVEYDFPLEVDIALSNLTGPSAGLMLTLGIINIMRGGGLAGYNRVAGTGEILADGSVGPIGGINHKLKAAADVGAQVFLAPEDNYAEIEDPPAGLRIFKVKNIEEALTALQSLE
jgi:PDZ domain-containing protein